MNASTQAICLVGMVLCSACSTNKSTTAGPNRADSLSAQTSSDADGPKLAVFENSNSYRSRLEEAQKTADGAMGEYGSKVAVAAAATAAVAKVGLDATGRAVEKVSAYAYSGSTNERDTSSPGSQIRGDTKPTTAGKTQFSKYAGLSVDFLIEKLGSQSKGVSADIVYGPGGGWVYVYDQSQQRQLAFCYGGSIDANVGDKVQITFSGQSTPIRILNLRSGKSAQIIDSF